ncbi:MAG: NADH-quinone oxidoreductase subunit M [Phycisphaerales bacterium]|jgi:NADH-quinone oxidoreductase subunit M|nr:NADH-quinone oxidoreductase subunit M [Phycisphaerales bacterium]
MLLLLILLPLAAAILVPFLGKRQVWGVALLGTLLPLIAGMVIWLSLGIDWRSSNGDISSLNQTIPWMPDLGVTIRLGLDSVSGLLVLLTLILGPIMVLCSKTAITERVRTYYGWILVLQAAMTGVFCARDLIFFYICFEFTLIPMFVLISLYGSTNRKAAAIKFFLYTFTGSIIALAGLVYIAWFHASKTGTWSFDLDVMKTAARSMPASTQWWLFLALMLGFAVKVPLFPLHTWLPLAHTEAPTAGSVVLAGVLLKLGTYAIYALAIPMLPAGAILFTPLLAVLAIIGFVAIGLVCWVQTDVKKLVAYSSVAHLGVCMLGMFALNPTGLQGSILYMINHGLSTGALFLLIGMMYERHHTRSMLEIGGLAKRMPIWATFMVFFAMASVGLPGLNGFVSEFMCLFGAWQASDTWLGSHFVAGTPGYLGPWYAVIAGVGMVVGAMYTLLMVGKVVWGPLKLPHDDHGHGHGDSHGGHDAAHAGSLPADLTGREIITLLPLAGLCLFLGLYPKPVLQAIDQSTQSTHKLILDARQTVRALEGGPIIPPMPASNNAAPADGAEMENAR